MLEQHSGEDGQRQKRCKEQQSNCPPGGGGVHFEYMQVEVFLGDLR